MELNAEQIKKRLEYASKTSQETAKIFNIPETPLGSTVRNALALILAYEEQIQELTEEIQKWQEAYDCTDAACRELNSKCDELTEENERLRRENALLEMKHTDRGAWYP